MMNLEEIQGKIKKEFANPLNPVLEKAFSNLEFGDEIQFSNVGNIKSDGEDKYTFDIAVPYRKYYLRCYYTTSAKPCITEVDYLPGIAIYLNVTSPELTYDQLSARLALTPSSGWSIGDSFKNGKLSRKFSSVKYNAKLYDNVPIGVMLKEFISTLVTSTSEINALSRIANVRIVVVTWSHISRVNGLLLDPETFEKISKLDISLDYDPYVYQD